MAKKKFNKLVQVIESPEALVRFLDQTDLGRDDSILMLNKNGAPVLVRRGSPEGSKYVVELLSTGTSVEVYYAMWHPEMGDWIVGAGTNTDPYPLGLESWVEAEKAGVKPSGPALEMLESGEMTVESALSMVKVSRGSVDGVLAAVESFVAGKVSDLRKVHGGHA